MPYILYSPYMFIHTWFLFDSIKGTFATLYTNIVEASLFHFIEGASPPYRFPPFDFFLLILFLMFPVTVLNVQFPSSLPFTGLHLKYMKNIQVWAECLQELCPHRTQKYTFLYKTAGCQSSTEVSVLRGKQSGVRHTESVHTEKHAKNNYSAANTACNPLKPHEAGQS